MEIDRRSFLKSVSLASGALMMPEFSRSWATEARSTVAKTRFGQVRGTSTDGVLSFKGIPYAGAPTGQYRFKAAPPLKPWSGVRDAVVYGPQSMQAPDPAWPKEWKPALSDEDCLYLNIWTPAIADGKKRAVMFYSHGGGFATGNGGADVFPQNLFHDGAALARDYDVVVVTHNHRLNIMGYLYLGDLLGEEYADSGMAGMLDIAAALKWVHENVENFGGDPDKIMIWGESGGGAKTTVLTAMPQCHGLFSRASVESGSAITMRTREAANETTLAVLSTLALDRKDARKLLEIPAKQLIENLAKLPPRKHDLLSISEEMSKRIGFSPVVDGHNLPANPYDPVAPQISAKVPLLVGTNRDETLFLFHSPDVLSMDENTLKQRLETMFQGRASRLLEAYHRSRPAASPAELFVAITTAKWMRNDAIAMAERKAKLNAAPVYMYLFAYDTQPSEKGAAYHSGAGHAGEIPFKFDHPERGNAAQARMARNMSCAWAHFAKYGNPSHDEIPAWPTYTLDRRSTMILDTTCKVVEDPYRDERLIWEELN